MSASSTQFTFSRSIPTTSNQRVVRATPGPKPVREAEEIRLVDGVQHLDGRPLDDLVLQRRDTERPQPSVRLRDAHPACRLRSVSAPLDPLLQVVEVGLQLLPVGLARHLVNPCRHRRAQRPVGHAQAIEADVMKERREPRRLSEIS
jgi:hypothetical protein